APQARMPSTHAPVVMLPAAPARAPTDPQPTAAPTPGDTVATPPPAAEPLHARARRPAGSPPSAAQALSQPSEVELISRAEDLVDRTPAAALELLGTHERLYPHGMLGEERDVLRVDAEWALGQRAAALGHARAFVRRYPGSTQTRRLSRLLADHNFQPAATPTE
ncbi:MAG TPA: hypothetical protein VJV78_32715, partial [Polyangiales bacterium]|nr:hypothetical protein [Polyangiales bacterium]